MTMGPAPMIRMDWMSVRLGIRSDHEPANAVLEGHGVEVHQQATAKPAELQVCQKLRFVHGQEALHCLQLDQHLLLDNDIGAKSDRDGMALVADGQTDLTPVSQIVR